MKKAKKNELKSLPPLKSDKAAEFFIETADLSTYDLSGFTPMRFEFEKKAVAINMRLPQSLLNAGKCRAEACNIPFTRYIRLLIEQDLQKS